MTYQPMGLAALVVAAIRGAVADPAVQEEVDRQGGEISAVRSAMDGITSRLSSIESAVADNGTLDEDQASTLSGIKAELADLATALAGPADNPDDNGVLAEVAPVEAAPESPAATEIVEQQTEALAGGGEEVEKEEEQQQEG